MKFFRVLLLVLFCLPMHAQKLTLYELSCEHKTNPIGIDVLKPRLSWKITGKDRNILQSAYALRVATDDEFSKNSIFWESEKMESGVSVLRTYAGPALQSAQRYYWQVKIWDQENKESDWSEAAFWEMGFINASDWKAKWIEPEKESKLHAPASLVRKEFELTKKVTRARAYISSHGLYEFYLNGNKVGDQVLTPGWTAYQERVQYQVYDITNQLQQGKNVAGAMIGDGWYRSALGWTDNWGIYGKMLGFIGQLHLTYSDGTEDIIITDETWKASNQGPITMSGIYPGETYDARKEIQGWQQPDFDDSKWWNVKTVSFPDEKLIASESVPMKKIQEIKPVKIFTTPKGTLVADMGQNMVGWIKLNVNGKAGHTITIRHAEVMDKFGEFYTDNLRTADATLRYVMHGEANETYEPHFTFMGFRFVAVEGFPGELTPENLTGVVIHSDMPPTGTFTCSNELVNQLQHNIQWGQKGNFLDVPTDCPQRDERLGWTGDAQAFCRTAAFNMDVAAFFTKWLKDLAIDQYENGGVPFVIPDVLRNDATSAGWGDVAVIAPYTMYQVYGDQRILEVQYPSMKAYVDYIRKKSGKSFLWRGGSIFGDWLYYKPKMESHTEPDGYTNPDMIATMFYAYSTKLLAETAGVLGKTEDQKTYTQVFDNIKRAFNKTYVTEAGLIASDSQTAYVLALMFDLLPESLRPMAANRLVNDIKARQNHLSTGFLGTPYLCHVLSDQGHTDVAYDILLQESYPSWLYPVKMGATTIWERWDGQKTDSTFQDIGMNSFNHYAYGAIGDWMYRVVAGLEIGAPGYKHIKIQPTPDSRLNFAKATFDSSYGEIASGWEMKDDKMVISVTIPANTTATVTLPNAPADQIMENGKSIQNNQDFKNVKTEVNNVIMDIGSGTYVFEYQPAK